MESADLPEVNPARWFSFMQDVGHVEAKYIYLSVELFVWYFHHRVVYSNAAHKT